VGVFISSNSQAFTSESSRIICAKHYLNILARHIEFTNAGGVDLALTGENSLKQRLPTPFLFPDPFSVPSQEIENSRFGYPILTIVATILRTITLIRFVVISRSSFRRVLPKAANPRFDTDPSQCRSAPLFRAGQATR